MKKFLSTAGFIDPVSLITLGILVVGLIVTTAIVKNPDISLDIRNYAKKSVSAPRTSVTKSVKDEIEKILSNPAPIQPPPVVKEKKQKDDDANTTPVVLPAPAQPAPTSISNTAMEEFRCGERGGDWKNGQCQSPGSTPIPTPKTVAPPPAVATPKPATNPFANITSGAGGGTIPKETTPTPTPKAVVPPPVVNPRTGQPLAPTKTPKPSSSLKLRSDGAGCVDDSECGSGTCQASVDGRICKYRNPAAGFAAGFSQNFRETTQNYSSENLIEDLTMFGPSLVAGILTLNPQASLATQQIMTRLPSWTQTAASVATLVEGPLAIIACQTQGANSPACQMAAMGITTGFFADPVGTLQGLQGSAQQVQNVVENSLDNTVFSGLTGDAYWGGGFSNSGGQTLISRSNMPANLTPQEQTLWLAKAEIAENWNYYTTLHPLTKSTFHGYQPYSASDVYQPASITQALNEAPDPLGYLQFLETQQGLSPNEILNNSRDFISQKGIMIAETPPPNNQWWIDLPNGQGVSWNSNLNLPFENPSSNLGTHQGPLTSRALTVEGTPFAFPSEGSFVPPYERYPGDVLELNRLALDQVGPAVELKTTSHELGHAIEQTYMPQREAYFWDFDEIKNKWVITQDVGKPATEFISTLYGIKASQAVAPYSLNMALDAINGNLFLNTWVTNPNPNYLAP